MKICFARIDRIGDLILTLPCEAIWKTERSQDSVTWLVSGNLSFVMNAREGEKSPSLFVSKVSGFFASIGAAFRLSKQLRDFDVFVAFHIPWWVALAAFWAGVPSRVGVASQWYSFIFFNRKIRQRRSQASKHESQYNLDLIQFALDKKNLAELRPINLSTSTDDLELLPGKYVVIHPGMAGSARNWAAAHYRQLAERLLEKNIPVVLTGSPTDVSFIEETGIASLHGVLNLVCKTPEELILTVLKKAKAVVVPSTGVAHLAASVGTRVVGIYSPVRVQAPRRWSPIGPKITIHCPSVECPGEMACLGKTCSQYDCMDQISVDAVAQDVIREWNI